ncbi:hypothetical protein ACPOL_2357 [Acidisarcina polymorpha]|uniref:Uncharacterized protein n=1 Tax=Acidisarcina polymorpha TaxID=2211140 RepID=A0A2Z5FXU5_9BACT|nr:DUF6580 family putative transport protein [Acidisarcina polymorpha]AXC11681.1 hypothetical protein ACPOL_2357 [Acidisarcina polymorpha]
MFAYLLTLLGVLAHAVPHAWLPFTAVGGSLLYFGARRPHWQGIVPVGLLALSDYYLTAHVYNFPFRAQDYLLTWAWYAAVIVLGAILLSSKTSVARIAAATAIAPTSFFLISNYAVWVSQRGMYPHTANGLMTCYTAALPFYRNDLVSTAIVTGLVFGIPLYTKHHEAAKQAQTL